MKHLSEVCTLSGGKITPYPADYRLALAFSDILYPLTRRLPLQVAFHLIVEIIGLTKFRSFNPTT
jgi:hypothetical protein